MAPDLGVFTRDPPALKSEQLHKQTEVEISYIRKVLVFVVVFVWLETAQTGRTLLPESMTFLANCAGFSIETPGLGRDVFINGLTSSKINQQGAI